MIQTLSWLNYCGACIIEIYIMSLEWYSFLTLYSFSVQNKQYLSSSENILPVGLKMYQTVFKYQQSFPFPDLWFEFRQHFKEREVGKNRLLFDIIYRLALAYPSGSVNLASKLLFKYIRPCASTVAKMLHTVQIFCFCKSRKGGKKESRNSSVKKKGGRKKKEIKCCWCWGVVGGGLVCFIVCFCFCCCCYLKKKQKTSHNYFGFITWFCYFSVSIT